MNGKVLICDDNEAIHASLSAYLDMENMEHLSVYDGAQVTELVKNENISFVILDIMLPVKNGIEICKEIRRFSNVPILFLTGRSEEIDRILGLEIGADDYVTKPFSPREVIARVKTILRRSAPANMTPYAGFSNMGTPDASSKENTMDNVAWNTSTESASATIKASNLNALHMPSPNASTNTLDTLGTNVSATASTANDGAWNTPDRNASATTTPPAQTTLGSLTIDMGAYEARVGGELLDLTPRELEILNYLVQNCGKVLRREQILDHIWGYDFYGDARAVDTQIKRLRKKISKKNAPFSIRSIYGIGYKLEAN